MGTSLLESVVLLSDAWLGPVHNRWRGFLGMSKYERGDQYDSNPPDLSWTAPCEIAMHHSTFPQDQYWK